MYVMVSESSFLRHRHHRFMGTAITLIIFFPYIFLRLQIEFLEAAAFAFCFTGIYVFAIELLSQKYRVLGNTIMSIAYAIGEILLGVAALYIHEYRTVMRVFCVPGLLIFLYFWIVPESVRWMLATGRIDRAIETLKRMAKFNRRQLSEKSIEMIRMQYSSSPTVSATNTEKGVATAAQPENRSVVEQLLTVFKSKLLCLRFLSCCYQFAACAFCYYGLGQSSTQIAGANRYVSFIIVMAIEIPGNILAQILLDRMKRKVLLLSMYMIAAVSVIATSTIPKDYSWAILLCFVVGKGSVTIAFTGLYMFVAEQWPTSIRNTIMNTCSMIGRIGSMVAPFVVVLVRIESLNEYFECVFIL